MEINGQSPLSVRPTHADKASDKASDKERKINSTPPTRKSPSSNRRRGSLRYYRHFYSSDRWRGYILVPLTPTLSLGELVVTQVLLQDTGAVLPPREDRCLAVRDG